VCLQLLDGGVNSSIVLGDKGDIVDEDWNDDLDVTLGVDVDRAISLETGEAKSLKDVVKLLVPLMRRLLKSIKRFVELANNVRTSLVIALRLTHVDLLLEVSIGKGRGNVD
jgi:hypothetical protein